MTTTESESVEAMRQSGLSVRAANALANAGIFDVRETDALSDTDLLDIKNLGARSALEIRTCRLRSLLAAEVDGPATSERAPLAFDWPLAFDYHGYPVSIMHGDGGGWVAEVGIVDSGPYLMTTANSLAEALDIAVNKARAAVLHSKRDEVSVAQHALDEWTKYFSASPTPRWSPRTAREDER